MADVLDYVNIDFDDLVKQLTDRVKQKSAWQDTYESSTGQMLIELFAYIGNMTLFYVERRAEELYIDTARFKSSIMSLVRLLNYIPKRNVSSTGTLQFSISPAVALNVFIPQYTQCKTLSGVSYLVSQDLVILAGQTSISGTGIQGELLQPSFVSDGSSNQSFKVEDPLIENSNFFVYVDNELWDRVSSFLASTSTSKHYRLIPQLDDTLTVQFSDGVNGKIPPAGKTVLIKYVRSLGLAGNVYETGKIVTVVSTIYDSAATVQTVTVTNTTNFLGGDDAEGIEEIRDLAPRVFKTGDRAVTASDFIAIIENYAGVGDANVWGENEETPPNYNYYNTVRISLILQNWILPDSGFKQNLTDFLYTKSMVTVKYEFIDPTILYAYPRLTVKVEKGKSLSSVQSDITKALQDEFDLGTGTHIGTSKRYTDVVAAVEAVNGVSYHYLTMELRKSIAANTVSGYAYQTTLEAVPILPGSVKLYIDNVLVATDDEAGTFTDQSSVYVVSGTINYTTGVFTASFSPGTNKDLVIIYQMNQTGDIVTTLRQIVKLYDVKYDSIGYVS